MITSFGDYVRHRRKMLDMTQVELADKVNCSLSMLRKIERDERRPSKELANLLADHLAVEEAARPPFMRLARGTFVPELPVPARARGPAYAAHVARGEGTSARMPFVARDEELRGLHSHLKEVVAGDGRLVFLVGEAGSGKTTLLREFASQAQRVWPRLLVAGGSCDIYTGLGDPLLPFREILHLLVGDVEHLSVASVLNHEHAARLRRALPTVAQALVDHGQDMIETLISSAALEALIAHILPEADGEPSLLERLHAMQSKRYFAGEPDLQQEQLFDEISTTLIALARRYPLLLMLDDLHWADLSSIGLLAHLARRVEGNAILVLGAFRPEDLAQGRPMGEWGDGVRHPLEDVLNESQRRFGENRIDLGQASSEAGRRFIDALLDLEPNRLGAGFRRRLVELTEGQPLFVVELLSDMKERGFIEKDASGSWVEAASLSWLHIPARVEGVVEKRIMRLPEKLRQMLTVASVQGESFAAEVSAEVLQRDVHEIIGSLSNDLDQRHRLVRERAVRKLGKTRLSQFQFRHQLFQKYTYERLGVAERIYLHEAVGEALEALYADLGAEEAIPASKLARHFQEAQRATKASHYRLLAGQDACRVLAYGEAAAHFERGLALLEGAESSAELGKLTFELRLALASAYWHIGRVAESVTEHLASIEMARTLAEPDALARAALAYEEPRWRLNLDAELSQQYIREALASIEDDEENALRVRLLVSLSRALLTSGKHEELRATVDQALTIGRQIDDPIALCDALTIRVQIDRRPEATASRLAAVEEMLALARSIGDKEREADGLDLFIYDQLELGNIELVDESIAKHESVANELGQPFQLHVAAVFQTMRAIMRGEFEEAERWANEAAELSRQMGIAAMDGIFGMHMFTIRREQGRLAEVAPLIKLFMASNGAANAWRPGLTLLYASLGQEDECRAGFDEMAVAGFADVARDSLRVASLAYLAEVCAYLNDAERAAQLYEWLLPYDGRAVVVGGATACYGAAARYLGMLAATRGQWAAAERHFEGALELDARMGARPWLAHSRHEYAVMLLARRQEGDGRQAQELLAKARLDATALGMGDLLEKVTVLASATESC